MDSRPRIRFTLPSIFWLIAVLASSLAVFGVTGIVFGGLVVFIWAFVYSSTKPGRRNAWYLLAFLSLLFFVMFPVGYAAKGASANTICLSNMKQIMLGLVNYEAANGQFPPPYIADQDGKPMHSWRVLILPHIGEAKLFARYRMDEPWDGPNNLKLLAEMPAMYGCPSQDTTDRCHYCAVLGEDTAWQVNEPVSAGDFSVGAGNTLMICETLHGVPWTKPEDTDPKKFFDEVMKAGLKRTSGGHLAETPYLVSGRYAIVGFADGRNDLIKLPVSVESMKAMASRHEEYDSEIPNALSFPPLVKWDRIIACVVWGVLCFLPFFVRPHSIKPSSLIPSS